MQTLTLFPITALSLVESSGNKKFSGNACFRHYDHIEDSRLWKCLSPVPRFKDLRSYLAIWFQKAVDSLDGITFSDRNQWAVEGPSLLPGKLIGNHGQNSMLIQFHWTQNLQEGAGKEWCNCSRTHERFLKIFGQKCTDVAQSYLGLRERIVECRLQKYHYIQNHWQFQLNHTFSARPLS